MIIEPADGGRRTDSRVGFQPSDWDTAPAASRELALLWEAHILEVETGRRPDQEEIRDEYDPGRPLTERLAAKVREFQFSDEPRLKGASLRTLQRRRSAYRDQGRIGLLDGRTARYDAAAGRVDPRVLALINEVLAEERGRSDRSTTLLMTEIAKRAYAQYPKAAAAILPSDATLRRRIDERRKVERQNGTARAQKNIAKHRKPKFEKRLSALPGNPVEIDSTPMDVLVRDGLETDGQPHLVRPILTVAIDEATRCILAFTILLDSAKAIDHVHLLLTWLVRPAALDEERAQLRAAARRENPGIGLRSDAEFAELLAAAPYVYPTMVISDRGMDFSAAVLQAALANLGIWEIKANKRTPTDKPLVERVFGTIGTRFVQTLPGYTGGRVEFRGEHPERDPGILTLHGLYERFHEWVLADYHHTPHHGLPRPEDPTHFLTPAQAFEQHAAMLPARTRELSELESIDFLPQAFVTIGDHGVRFHNREYDADELAPLRHTLSDDSSHGHKWKLKYHPYLPNIVWVMDNDGRAIACHDRELTKRLRQPDFRDLSTAEQAAARRAEVHRRGAALSGVVVPQPAPAPTPERRRSRTKIQIE